MEALLTFLLNASVGIILFYMVYWLFLRKETYYNLNRYFLLSALLFSALIPLFPFQYEIIVEQEQRTNLLVAVHNTFKTIQPTISENGESTFNLGWMEALALVYLTGVSIFLLRLLTQSVILFRLMIKYKIKSLEGIRIVENEKYGLPFSFFNIVFINPKFHKQDDLPEILAHEKVHIRENHWADLLIIELLTVIFWFNPFIWFFERSIKQNHEYLADSAVISNGSHVGKYQALLVNQLMGMQIIGITNNLNFALNTNRLKMMTKQKTPKIRAFKLAWALPAIAILLLAFAEPNYRVKTTNNSNTRESAGRIDSGKEVTLHGKVIRQADGKPLPGATVLIKGTTIGTVADEDGNYKLTNPNPTVQNNGSNLTYSTNIVVSYVGYKTVVNNIKVAGDAMKNNKFTFEMEEGAILIDLEKALKEVPPPPPPPKVKKAGDVPPPPPPPTLKKGEKEEVFFIVESLPVYPGGHKALAGYVLKMAKKYAIAKKVKGKALVGFTVDEKGDVSNIQVLEKENDMAAKAAYSIVDGLEKWKPGSQRGKAVPVNYTLPIEF